jgi:hypothetical protein
VAHLRRRRTEWVVSQQVHPKHCGELADSPPDPSVTDDADRCAVQVTHGNLAAIRPPAIPHEIGQRPQSLHQMRKQREYTLGDGSGSTPRCDHDRDTPCRGRAEVDVVDTDTGTRDDAQLCGAGEKRGINDGVGPHDRADGIGDVPRAGIGDKCNFLAEDPGDQRPDLRCRVPRLADGRQSRPQPTAIAGVAGSPPNVARGTAGTCCHVPRSLEAAAAARTSAT